MRLAALAEFRRLVYTPESAPAPSTLRRNIEKIPGGQRIGGRCYVDLDAFDRATNLREGIRAREQELAENPLLDGLL